MNKITGHAYSGETVTVDDTYFDGCDFDGCTLVFCGKAVFAMANCRLFGCTWALEDHAGITIQFLTAMYHSFGADERQTVENLFQSIRTGGTGKPDSLST